MPQRPKPGFTSVKRRRGPQALADLVAPSIGPAVARQGFGELDVLMHWPDIVGLELASHCHPVKLQWRGVPAGGAQAGGPPATLVVRVEGAFALSLQHMAPVILERVNTHLGWACVGKLALRQGPLPLQQPKRSATSPADPEAACRAARSAEAVSDDGLRAALTRLGSRVLAQAPRPRAATPEK